MLSTRSSCFMSLNLTFCFNIVKRFNGSQPKVPYLTQNNGTKVPHIGLGTYKNIKDCESAVKFAIQNGYRSIDTAYYYENEVQVGKAIHDTIAEGIVKREDLFITTKLWNTFHDPNIVEHACRLSLKNLGLDYVDLYLMHWPMAYDYQGDHEVLPLDCDGRVIMSSCDYVDTWKAMEKLVDLLMTESIGVSNFNATQLNRLISSCKTKPVQNQVEKGTIPLAKSVTPNRIIENIAIFDFELKESDHRIISEFHTGERVAFMAEGMHSKYYPFSDVLEKIKNEKKS